MLSFLNEQIHRVRVFATWCTQYTFFKPLLDVMNASKTDKYVKPLRIQEMWMMEFCNPETDEFLRVGKLRTVDEAQSLAPGYESVTNYTDIIYTEPSLIMEHESVTKEVFATRLADKMHNITGTGMERVILDLKEQILLELLNENVDFGGIDEGYTVLYCGRNADELDPQYLKTRVCKLFRPGEDRWLMVDGVVMTPWG